MSLIFSSYLDLYHLIHHVIEFDFPKSKWLRLAHISHRSNQTPLPVTLWMKYQLSGQVDEIGRMMEHKPNTSEFRG